MIKNETAKSILKFLLSKEKTFFRQDDSSNYMSFLVEVWNLKKMPSTDKSQYSSAYEEIKVRGLDSEEWDIEYVLVEYLKVIEDQEHFFKLLQTSVSPLFRGNIDEIEEYIAFINPLLKRDGFAFAPINSSGFEFPNFQETIPPIYEIFDYELVKHLPTGINVNKIPFYISAPKDGHSIKPDADKTPYFVLHFNSGWNDYGHRTIFELEYYSSKNNFGETIGNLKLIYEDSRENVIEKIESVFENLSSSFCSLAMTAQFYYNLRDSFKNNYKDILFALKDSAFFPQIQEKFERTDAFQSSLLRGQDSGRILRLMKHQMDNESDFDFYNFHFHFTPPYSNETIDIHFDFKLESETRNRVYAIIGENGTGKTRLMSRLPMAIAKKESTFFKPRIPFFSKIIAVSYSAFDDFEIPKKNAAFNYHHCGLRKEDGDSYTKAGLVLRFQNTRKEIQKKGRVDRWRSILLNFIDKDIVDLFIKRKANITDLTDDESSSSEIHVFRNEQFAEARRILSSGQSILMYMITEIIANIQLDSIILYDEPETHLHPNAISRLINAIYNLIEEFESYCIIATHSPMVIREIPSSNVYVLERDGNYPSIKKIGIESFGENLSVLTDEVFGNKSIEKQYKTIIEKLVKENLDYETVVERLESGVPMSLNASLYTKSLIIQRDEEL